MFVFFFILLSGFMVLFGGYTNYLMILLSFELMFYGCFFYFMIMSCLMVDLISIVVLLVFIVCGGCYGLCLLIFMNRSVGSDLIMF